jgi:hypothetical protein
VTAFLGSGAHGRVYAVEDPDAGVSVALKVLNSHDRDATDLKREFRVVADLAHPNLVLPYALENEGDVVFFTMELIVGEPLLDWIASAPPEDRERRLRSGFGQLADGLLALHQRGVLHRDIKSPNVLVGPNERVAILDFGLASRLDGDRRGVGYLVGTPGYLAPELLAGTGASEATDAYAVGVLLYQALARGHWPYAVDVQKSVARRSFERSAPLVDAEPAELAQLCMRLLDPDPTRRIKLADFAAALRPWAARAMRPSGPMPVLEREVELETLTLAFERVRRERTPRIVHLPGRSGMGKSTLLRLLRRHLQPRACVLEGRAYESDSIPFKTLDAAMDQLARQLASLPEPERNELAPSEPALLSTLFPSLGAAFGVPISPNVLRLNPIVHRTRGAHALRELLGKVADRSGLVLMLDDLQWGDLDSARLLSDLLTAPAPAVLVVFAYRTERRSTFLAHFERAAPSGLEFETVPVNPLSPNAALQLTRAISGSAEGSARIARESDGCPFLIEMALSTASDAEAEWDFQKALADRVAQLSAAARGMLEAVCIAAQPLPRGRVPFTPAQVPEARAAWASLLHERMLRSDGRGDLDLVEVCHDRIREAVVQSLPRERQVDVHLALANSFAEAKEAEGAAIHFSAAGDRSNTLTFAQLAAQSALGALAFDRAAELLAMALQACPPDATARRVAIKLERARALANAGRGGEAAPLILECAAERSGIEALQLQREAMEQFLIAGRLDEGRPVMQQLLHELKVWSPTTPLLTRLALYAEGARLLLRGPAVRPSRALSAHERLLLETFGSIGTGFAAYDADVGAWFFLRAAKLALEWGEAKVAVRGIIYTASLLSFAGSPWALARGDAWLTRAEELARQHGDGHGLAFSQVGRGIMDCCAGRWEAAVRTLDNAARALDGKYAASVWEANTAKSTTLFALIQRGDLRELETRADTLTQEARNRGDLALEVESNLYLALTALAADDPPAAHRCIDRNRKLWTIRGYHFQHWIALRFRTLTRLYEGSFFEALADFDEELPRAQAANLTSMQVVRIEAHDFHGRAALGAAFAASRRQRARLAREVAKDINALLKERRAHALAPATMLRAGLSALHGKQKEAQSHLQRAAALYAEAEMPLHALAARLHVAVLNEASDEVDRATRALHVCGVRAPASWARMHLPLER